MKILIDMALEHYDGFVAKCDVATREYAILKNGVVIGNQKSDEQIIAILCERADAVMLLYAAGLLYPEAVAAIKAGLDRARES